MKRMSSRDGVKAGRTAGPGWTIWLATAALVLGIGPARSALAWGRTAHRAASRVADSRLTPEARAAIRELLEPGESLVDASTWADENSRSMPGSAGWHFVNVNISAPRYTSSDCHGNCVVSRLEEFRRILADPRAPRARRQMALRYVVHLVEDLHQPLHVGDRRDRGGNNVQLSYFRDDLTNLHQVWDSGLLRNGFRNERAIADELFDLARSPEARDWPRGSVEDWVNESLEAARQAYRVPGSGDMLRSGMRIGREYQDANLPIATRRLAQAGVRLSEVLNEALTPPRKNAVPPPHFPKPGQTRPAPVPAPPAAGIQ